MIVTFCGHAKYYGGDEVRENLINILEREVGNTQADFYLGGYGGFDGTARNACRLFQKKHPHCRLYFISPYQQESYIKSKFYLFEDYDGVLIPDINNSFTKAAILNRNKWMVEHSDLVIAYVDHPWGGASKTLEIAQKLKKKIYNLAKKTPQKL